MADQTHISWADMTHNEWVGCTKVSNGPLGACEGCYACNLMETRFSRVEFGGPGKGVGTRSLTSEANRRKPFTWDRKAAKDGTRPFVFCSSLSDVFDSDVPAEWRAALFDKIRRTPHLIWLLLTKRPGNIVKLAVAAGGLPPNAAIGCTVVTQAEADRDIPKLLAAKAALKPAFAFLSMEPLLGPVGLTSICLQPKRAGSTRAGIHINALKGQYVESGQPYLGDWDINLPPPSIPPGQLDWIITGGETDQGAHKARPSHPDWFRGLRDQCAAAGVPYHHKQNGEWAACQNDDGHWPINEGNFIRLEVDGTRGSGGWPMQRVGKKAAGRTLDGVIHDERPIVHAR
jgi:protein gp37